MYKQIFLALALLCPLAAQAQVARLDTSTCQISGTPPSPPAEAKKKPKKQSNESNRMFLSRVVCEVEHALDAYQQSEDVAEKALLPGLATADFDFKTVVDTKGGLSINFLIFKFGGTVEKQDTNDVDF